MSALREFLGCRLQGVCMRPVLDRSVVLSTMIVYHFSDNLLAIPSLEPRPSTQIFSQPWQKIAVKAWYIFAHDVCRCRRHGQTGSKN